MTFCAELNCRHTKATQISISLKTSLHNFCGRQDSSLRSGWTLRIIHISDDIVSFLFYVDLFFPLSLTRLLPDLTKYIRVARRMSYKKQELITLHEHLGSHPFIGGIHVAHRFLCCVFFFKFWYFFVLCFVFPMLPVSSDCLFLTAPLVS
jgi:hypothetical protein